MKLSILYAGLARPHAGWLAIDELAILLADYYSAEVLSPQPVPASLPSRLLHRGRENFLPLSSRGGDALIVVARNPGDLAMVRAIPNWRKRFGQVFGIITDSYFHQGYPRETAAFDAITVTAHEDIAYPVERFGIAVYQLYQGADCLRWAPTQQVSREIDVIGFGRTPPSYHNRLADLMHQAESPYLYLHSPLGNLSGAEVRRERGMLFKLLQRTRISLAFHMYVEPQGDRPRSMMVTSRWLESLLSGCLVAGKKPQSRMADEMLSWPGATIELADQAAEAVDELLDILMRNDSYQQQRRRNIGQMLKNHDWRYRIDSFCRATGLPQPDGLSRDLEQLQQHSDDFLQGE